MIRCIKNVYELQKPKIGKFAILLGRTVASHIRHDFKKKYRLSGRVVGCSVGGGV